MLCPPRSEVNSGFLFGANSPLLVLSRRASCQLAHPDRPGAGGCRPGLTPRGARRIEPSVVSTRTGPSLASVRQPLTEERVEALNPKIWLTATGACRAAPHVELGVR